LSATKVIKEIPAQEPKHASSARQCSDGFEHNQDPLRFGKSGLP
jgi:hypothetical protein